jgi:hypothetical protein
MDFLSNINWVQVLCFVCPAALGVAGWVISSLIDERIRGRREAHKVALRKRGMTVARCHCFRPQKAICLSFARRAIRRAQTYL